MTENGTRCQNPAFADGYCWMHGGTGQKSGDMTDAPFPTDISPDSSAPDDLVELPSSLPEIDGSSEMELPPPLPEIDTPPETELPPPLKETDASPEAELPPPLPEVDVPPEAELPPPLPEIDVPPEAELPPPLPEIDASPETELPPPLPEIDASPEQEVFDTDIEPVFSQESENTDPGSSAEPSAPENGMESIEEETPLMLDPSDFEFKPDPESAAEDVELPSDSDSSGMPTVPEKEDATGLPDIDDGLIELDLTGLDLEVQEPPVEPSNEIEAVSESTFDDTPEGDGSDASEPLPEGDIQMPESFRLEMASEKEKALPEPEDSPEEPEHDLDQVEMDETLELEMDFSDKDLGLSSEEPIKDDVPADTPDRMPEEETPDDDLEMIPASPGHEPPREVRESDVLLPGMEPDTAPPVEDTAPDAKVSEGESEKVVAPPPSSIFSRSFRVKTGWKSRSISRRVDTRPAILMSLRRIFFWTRRLLRHRNPKATGQTLSTLVRMPLMQPDPVSRASMGTMSPDRRTWQRKARSAPPPARSNHRTTSRLPRNPRAFCPGG